MGAGSGAAACLPGCSAEMGPSVAGQAAFFGGAVLQAGMLVYLPGDALKTALAVLLARTLRRRLPGT